MLQNVKIFLVSHALRQVSSISSEVNILDATYTPDTIIINIPFQYSTTIFNQMHFSFLYTLAFNPY